MPNPTHPIRTTVLPVRLSVHNRFGTTPIALAADKWGPTVSPLVEFVPIAAGISTAITVHTVMMLAECPVAPTSALLRLQLDPAGRAAMATHIEGAISVSDAGADLYNITWRPEVVIGSNQALAGLLPMILSSPGQFWAQFLLDEKADVNLVVVTYSLNDIGG